MPLSCGADDTLCGPFAVRGSMGVGGFIANCIRKKRWFGSEWEIEIEIALWVFNWRFTDLRFFYPISSVLNIFTPKFRQTTVGQPDHPVNSASTTSTSAFKKINRGRLGQYCFFFFPRRSPWVSLLLLSAG